MDLAVPADHRVKLKESEKRDNYQDLARDQKKTMEHESDGDTNCNRYAQYNYQRIGKGTGRVGNKNTSGGNLSDSTVKISQNIEKSPGDLRRLAVI